MPPFFSYLSSTIYYTFFCGALLVFHPIQVLCFHLFGINAQKKTVDVLNWTLLLLLKMIGTSIKFNNTHSFPKDRTLIFVSNHQSTYDIPPLIWHLRKYAPKFVAKKELGKGLPSISYHLRKGGNVLINRKNSTAALKAIKEFSRNVYNNRWSVVIFPEGTRSRNGVTKNFHQNGLQRLLSEIPDALIVPISINNSWKLAKWNYFPIPLGVNMKIDIHCPIEPNHSSIKQTLEEVEQIIKAGVKN